MFARRSFILGGLFLASACTMYHDVREIKLIGFSEDVRKGKAVGQVESDDCVFQALGHYLGGSPDISRAIANAQTGKKSQIGDVVGASEKPRGESVRYINNLTVIQDGFSAMGFGKNCIEVRGMGYR
jgi:hypothetical protein